MAFIAMLFAFVFVVLFSGAILSTVTGLILLIINLIKKNKSTVLKAVSIILLAVGLPMTLLGTAIIIKLAPEPAPETIEVDGITYRTGFYGDMSIRKVDEIGDRTEYDEKYICKIEHDRFDIYLYSDISFGDGSYFHDKYKRDILYCREDQYGEAKAYYSSEENFSVRYNRYLSAPRDILESYSVAEFEEIFKFTKDKEHMSEDTLVLSDKVSVDYFLYKESSDRIFFRTAGPYNIIDGGLYVKADTDAEKGTVTYEKIPDELGKAVITAIEKK